MTVPLLPPGTNRAVKMVSGKVITVMTDVEAEWFEETRDAYLYELKFTEKTDLVDLDRMLILELMVFRWTLHLASGVDYDGDMVDEKKLTADIKLYSDQLNKVKETMGLSKKSRDSQASEGNFASWLSDLKSRAKVFGVHRQHQLTKALSLMNELSAVVGAFDRSDVEERRKLGFDDEVEILAWIRSTMLPEYHALDEFFRANEHRYWVRDL